MKTESTGRIRIAKVPAGEAPFEIRQQWVGLILPCDPHLGYPDEGLDQSVLSNKKVSHNQCGFSVPQDQAIVTLEKECPNAAAWWKAHGFPKAGGYFGFKESEAEIIDGVVLQQVVNVTEEMMGDPNR